ncbi:MAG: hypothetical protein PHU53_02945 [Thermoplasmata archaeon]|nr:hypothetical protein [Thermoplasmata archaeon]
MDIHQGLAHWAFEYFLDFKFNAAVRAFGCIAGYGFPAGRAFGRIVIDKLDGLCRRRSMAIVVCSLEKFSEMAVIV